MSIVTNAILHMGVMSEKKSEQKLQEVNAFFEDKEDEKDKRRGFVSLDDKGLPDSWYGGSKALECELAVGAFNYLHLDDLIEHLQAIQWDDPAVVQLMVKEQNDDVFRIIDVFKQGA